MTPVLPTVVLVDPDCWDSLRDWGAALRRRGVRVRRVRPRAHGMRGRLRDVRDRITLGHWPVDTVAEALVDEPLDVIATETVLAQQFRPWVSGGTPRVRAGLPRSVLWDKWHLHQCAEAWGLSVPESWQGVRDVLPVMVKCPTGFGGLSVRRADDELSLTSALAEFPDDVFFQEALDGDIVNVSGVADRGEVLVVSAYRALASANDPLGPPEHLQVIDAPALLEEALTLLFRLRYTGVFALDYVMSDDGRWWLLELNPRPFGGWLALQRSGLDVVGSYLSLLGIHPTPAQHALPHGLSMHDQLSIRDLWRSARIIGWGVALPVVARGTVSRAKSRV